jgi:hypothetical protein
MILLNLAGGYRIRRCPVMYSGLATRVLFASPEVLPRFAVSNTNSSHYTAAKKETPIMQVPLMDYSTKFASYIHLFSTDSYSEWDKLAAVDGLKFPSSDEFR